MPQQVPQHSADSLSLPIRLRVIRNSARCPAVWCTPADRADKWRFQPLDVRRRFSRASDSFNRAENNPSCKTQLSSSEVSSSGKGSSDGSTACTCGGQTR